MKILACNVGSTSLKMRLYDMPAERLLAEAKIERIGSVDDALYHYRAMEKQGAVERENLCVPTYAEGINLFLADVLHPVHGALASETELDAIGYKTVLAKGYHGVHELTDEVLEAMEQYNFVAPAHNGPYLEAIRMFKRILPDTLMVGVFETAFHTTIPLARRLYAVPFEWYEQYGIMRMGYHGASHAYVAESLGREGKMISCHLGGSCSICAIRDGQSVDNSFGFSLQTGIPHANRSGDLDAYVLFYLLHEGIPMETILEGLTRRGGLHGISGVSGDMRFVREAADSGNLRAHLAIEHFADRVVHYIGAYFALLGGLTDLAFTGGIGENDWRLRRDICERVRHMGVELSPEANRANAPVVSAGESRVRVSVIPANEEIMVVRKTYALSMNGGMNG